MRRKGFSFACLAPVSNTGEAFQRFLKTAKADPSKINNPYPQIVCSDNFTQAYTQPLLMLSYVPDYEPNIQDTSTSLLKKQLTLFHEYAHQIYSISPAKILARFLLARAYAKLNYLLVRETWDEESWREIAAMNARLTVICNAITVSEELMAIALSFNTLDLRVYLESQGQKLLLELEKSRSKCTKNYHQFLQNCITTPSRRL
jgi:hypothetical protein